MLCGPPPATPIERSRHSNQCDLEHTNVNDIQRYTSLSPIPVLAAYGRTSSKEFMATRRCHVAPPSVLG